MKTVLKKGSEYPRTGLPLCSKTRISPGEQLAPGPSSLLLTLHLLPASRPPSLLHSAPGAPASSAPPTHTGAHLWEPLFPGVRVEWSLHLHCPQVQTPRSATYLIQPPRLLDCSPHRCRLWRIYFCMCLFSISLTRMSGPRRMDPPAYFTAASQHLTQREHSAQTHSVNESLPPPPCTNPITHLHTSSHTGEHIQLSDLAR